MHNSGKKSRHAIYLGAAVVTVIALVLSSCATTEEPAEPVDMVEPAAETEAPVEVAEPDPEAAEELEQLEMMDPEEMENGFAEARDQVEQQMIQERQSELLMEHLAQLQEDADVETYLEVMDEGDEQAVVAVVNGQEIAAGELMQQEQQQMQQMMMMGMDPDSEEGRQMLQQIRPRILDNLIHMVLVEQKAAEAGITASDEDVEEYYQDYIQQFDGEDALLQQLEQAGMTEEDLRREIAAQLPIQFYVEQFFDSIEEAELDFSEEELREYYEMQQMQQQMQQMQ